MSRVYDILVLPRRSQGYATKVKADNKRKAIREAKQVVWQYYPHYWDEGDVVFRVERVEVLK